MGQRVNNHLKKGGNGKSEFSTAFDTLSNVYSGFLKQHFNVEHVPEAWFQQCNKP